MDEWRPIVGYEGLYAINRQGQVRRVARGKTLTVEAVKTIKEMLAAGATLKVAAQAVGTSIPTVASIKHGRTWTGDETFRCVKVRVSTDFYLRFSACKDGKYHHVAIHRALWEAFVGPIPGRMEINHKNLDRQDNRLENLEIVTHQENIAHAMARYNAERKHLSKGNRSGPRSQYAKIKHT